MNTEKGVFMPRRPFTYKFSEYPADPDGSPVVELITARARRGGTLTTRRRGRPWPKQAREWREKANELVVAVEELLLAGASYSEVAALLDVPEAAVREFGVEV